MTCMTGWASLICRADNLFHRLAGNDNHWACCRLHDWVLRRRTDLD